MGPVFTGLRTNIMVTVLMLVMVIVMPIVDRLICKKIGIETNDRLSENPNADHYLHIRKILLFVIFGLYLIVLFYVAWFSRSAYEDFKVQTEFMGGLQNQIQIDFGFLGFIKAILTDGFASAMEHVRLRSFESLDQIYLNIVMFVPMGYLLPYVSDWFRRNMRVRVIVACFLTSVLIENVQLVTKLGFYDVDDLFTNTLGGLIGQILYVLHAYSLAHPDWKKEFKELQRYTKRMRQVGIQPRLNNMHTQRVTLFASNEDEVFDFFAKELGFRIVDFIDQGKDVSYLFAFGKSQVEVRCSPRYTSLQQQEFTIACNNSEFMKKRLDANGIKTSPYESDPYTKLRLYKIVGPDNMFVTIIEE